MKKYVSWFQFPFFFLFSWSVGANTIPPSALPLCGEAWNNEQLDRYYFAIDPVKDAEGSNIGYQDTYKDRIRDSGVDRRQCQKEWTIMVYMAADNNLDPYAFWDLYEMEASIQPVISREFPTKSSMGASSLRTDLLVQLDAEGKDGIRRYHMFQSLEDFDVNRNQLDFAKSRFAGVHSPLVDRLPETGPADISQAERFQNFLNWAIENYPAKHYMVVVWGHGQGWAPDPPPPIRVVAPRDGILNENDLPMATTIENTSTVEREAEAADRARHDGGWGGAAFNYRTGDYLSIPQINEAFKYISETRLAGEPIDIFAANACLMQMLEVAYELSSHTRYIVGSAQLINYLGFPWRELMTEVNSGDFFEVGGGDEPQKMARLLPVIQEHYNYDGNGATLEPEGRKTMTMTSINSYQLRWNLAPELYELSITLKDYVKESYRRHQDIKFLLNRAPSFMGGAVDFTSALELFQILLKKEKSSEEGYYTETSRKLEALIPEVQRSINETVEEFRMGDEYRIAKVDGVWHTNFTRMKGISIWFPRSRRAYQRRVDDFRQSQLYKNEQLKCAHQHRENCDIWLEYVYGKKRSGLFAR